MHNDYSAPLTSIHKACSNSEVLCSCMSPRLFCSRQVCYTRVVPWVELEAAEHRQVAPPPGSGAQVEVVHILGRHTAAAVRLG